MKRQLLLIFLTLANASRSFGSPPENSFPHPAVSAYAQARTHYLANEYLLSFLQFSVAWSLARSPLEREKSFLGQIAASTRLGNWTLAQKLYLSARGDLSSESRGVTRTLLATHDLDAYPDLAPEERRRVVIWQTRYEIHPAEIAKPSGTGELVREIQSSRTKSPTIAGLLSAVLPGSGQVYSGAYQSAALAFLLNGIFGWSTVELIQARLTGPAVASGMVWSVVYAGNILNASKSASQFNDSASRMDEKRLEGILFPILDLRF